MCLCVCANVLFFLPHRQHLFCPDLYRSNTNSFFFFAPTAYSVFWNASSWLNVRSIHEKCGGIGGTAESIYMYNLRIRYWYNGNIIKIRLNTIMLSYCSRRSGLCKAVNCSLNIEAIEIIPFLRRIWSSSCTFFPTQNKQNIFSKKGCNSWTPKFINLHIYYTGNELTLWNISCVCVCRHAHGVHVTALIFFISYSNSSFLCR